jgi:hypothetical protein
MKFKYRLSTAALLLTLLPLIVQAQVTQGDYERAAGLRRKYDGLAVNIVDRYNWIGKTDHLWYRKSVKGGNEFVLVDAETLTKKPAFDHEKLAASLSTAMGKKYTALTLPITTLTFLDNEQTIEFVADASRWRCSLSDYTCQNRGPAGPPFGQQNNPDEEPPAATRETSSSAISTSRPGTGPGAETKNIARRKVGSVHRELQRLCARERQQGWFPPEFRRFRRRLLHALVDQLVARFETPRGLLCSSRFQAAGVLRGIVSQ